MTDLFNDGRGFDMCTVCLGDESVSNLVVLPEYANYTDARSQRNRRQILLIAFSFGSYAGLTPPTRDASKVAAFTYDHQLVVMG